MTSDQIRIPVLIGVAVLLVLGGLFYFNRGYGEVSPKTYEYATALFSICNRKDEARLEKISEMINESVASEEVSETEAGWLLAIVDEAKSGEWESALEDSRNLMEDQVDGR